MNGIENMKQLLDHLKGISSQFEEVINHELKDFAVNLVLNKVSSPQDISVGSSTRSVCMKYFGFNTRFSGYVGFYRWLPLCW